MMKVFGFSIGRKIILCLKNNDSCFLVDCVLANGTDYQSESLHLYYLIKGFMNAYFHIHKEFILCIELMLTIMLRGCQGSNLPASMDQFQTVTGCSLLHHQGFSNYYLLPSAIVVVERLCFHRHLSFCPQGACMAGGHAWQGACMAWGHAWQGEGTCMAEGACVVGGMCGRGYAWQGACGVGAMCGRGKCMVGACMARGVCVAGGHAWHGWGHVWQEGACVVGGSMHGRRCTWQGGMCGRRDGHYSRQYTSYWNAFFLVFRFCHLILILYYSSQDGL